MAWAARRRILWCTEVTAMHEPEISYVTWSSKGIRVVYSGAMVVHLSAEDMYPLAVQAKVISLVDSERNTAAKAS
jgi:hypothetical protein